MAAPGESTTLVIGKERVDRLRQVSKETGIAQSYWLRELIDTYLDPCIEKVLTEKLEQVQTKNA